MAYTSVADARTKLMDPTKEHASVILYGSDNTLSSTTTFYTDAGKTLIAPAGNYVIPTNYKSYYITLNSSGKMIGSPQELSASLYDTSWVDDSVYQNEDKVSNTNYAGDGTHGGTAYVLNTASLTLTDTIYTSRPPTEGMYKLWSINGGTKSSANFTDIDLSDMRGYDLQIISGDWQTSGRTYQGQPTSEGYSSTTLTQTTAVVHLADDPNRVSITGSLIYTFKPDYFVTSASYDPMTYHKRLPDVLPIEDNTGYQKQLFDMFFPNSDLWYKGDTPDSTTRVRRTPTRHKKGQYARYESISKRFPSENQPNGEDKYYYERDYFTNLYDRLIFDGDEWIKQAVARGAGVPFSSVTPEQAFVMMKSLTVDDDTWANGSSNGLNYRDVNQYHWTTAINSGTGWSQDSPANAILGFFTSGNSKSRDMDWEIFGQFGQSAELGTSFNACYQNAKTYALANNQIPSGGFIPEMGYYGGGPYNSTLFGQTGRGWYYVQGASSLADLKTKPIFKDYNDYLIDGTQTYSNTITNEVFRTISPSFHRFYITDYNHYVNPAWFLYALVHNYDITKKLLVDLLGAEAAESKRVMSYFWHYTEPIDAADMGFERKGWDKWENLFILQYRSEVPPSMMQSLAVWSFAYADGAFLWAFYDGGVEDREAYAWWIGQPYVNDVKILYAFGSILDRQHGLNDWLYNGYRQVLWNKDIVEANTSWLKPEVYRSGSWITGQDNQPTTLCYQQAPISAYKMSADGTEALLIITNPFNNGYTKVSHRVRFPQQNNKEVTVDTWGTFTTVVRVTNFDTIIYTYLRYDVNTLTCGTSNPTPVYSYINYDAGYYYLNGSMSTYYYISSNPHTDYTNEITSATSATCTGPTPTPTPSLTPTPTPSLTPTPTPTPTPTMYYYNVYDIDVNCAPTTATHYQSTTSYTVDRYVTVNGGGTTKYLTTDNASTGGTTLNSVSPSSCTGPTPTPTPTLTNTPTPTVTNTPTPTPTPTPTMYYYNVYDISVSCTPTTATHYQSTTLYSVNRYVTVNGGGVVKWIEIDNASTGGTTITSVAPASCTP